MSMTRAAGGVGAVVLARMDSTRLPGKALRELGGEPLIGWVLQRVERARSLDGVIIATTAREVDAPLVAWARSTGRRVWAEPGGVDDVADRFINACNKMGWAWGLRVNGDSLLVDPALVDAGVGMVEVGDEGVDLVTNLVTRSHPYGVAVEVVRVSALRRLVKSGGLDAADREHVTRALYRALRPERVASMERASQDWSGVRSVVDTPEDLARWARFVAAHGREWPMVGWEAAARWFRADQSTTGDTVKEPDPP